MTPITGLARRRTLTLRSVVLAPALVWLALLAAPAPAGEPRWGTC